MATTPQKRGTFHSSMGRPKTGSLGTFSSGLVKTIRDIRENHEGHGPTSILADLVDQYGYQLSDLPSRSSIAAFLRQEGLSKRHVRRSDLIAVPCSKATQEHEQWQLDGRGVEYIEGVGPIALLDIKDVYSSTYVGCFPALMKHKTSHPSTDDYQTALRLAFMEYGLPVRIQVDHASVFYENNSTSPFPTRLHLWLKALGVEICYSRVRQPKDQAQVERSHQTLYNQIMKSQLFQSWEELYLKCQQRRQFLNYKMPSCSCGEQPPLIAYPKAKHSERYYNPLNEEKHCEIKNVYQYLSQGKWYRKIATNKTVSLGRKVYYLAKAIPGQQAEITFCPDNQNLRFHDGKELLIAEIPIKGYEIKDLIGNLGEVINLPSLQLPIPYNWEQIKINTTLLDSS